MLILRKAFNYNLASSYDGDKSVETRDIKFRFLSVLVTFPPPPPFPPKQCWFFYLFYCTDQSAFTTLIWGGGGRGIRELTLDVNKIEQMLKNRKASFPKSVSTTFAAHCSLGTVVHRLKVHLTPFYFFFINFFIYRTSWRGKQTNSWTNWTASCSESWWY